MKPRPNVEDGRPVSFEELMELERINDTTYRSLTQAFEPGAPTSPSSVPPKAYGGHVYAQAVWAASHTVAEDFVVNACPSCAQGIGTGVRLTRDGRLCQAPSCWRETFPCPLCIMCAICVTGEDSVRESWTSRSRRRKVLASHVYARSRSRTRHRWNCKRTLTFIPSTNQSWKAGLLPTIGMR